MIPAIGLMVGAYICTRMLGLILIKQEYEGSNWLKILLVFAAIGTIIITVICVVSILSSSIDTSTFK